MDMQYFRDELDQKITGAEHDIADAKLNLKIWQDRRDELPPETDEWIIETADERLEVWENSLKWAERQLDKWKRRREALENVEFIDKRKK